MGKTFEALYPVVFALVLVFIGHTLGINYEVQNFDKVLDGSITFGSVVVGFLAALLGILLSIRDSEVVQEIFEENQIGTLKYYFNETIILGFAVVFLSIGMHVLKDKGGAISDVLFYLWALITFWFVPSIYRIVSLLMAIFFKSNMTKKRPPSNRTTGRRKEELRKALAKKAE